MLINNIKLLVATSNKLGYILFQVSAACLYLVPISCIDNEVEYNYAFVLSTFILKMVVMTAISYGLQTLTAKKPPKPQHAKPSGLEQFDIPTAQEGRPLQVLFGKKYIKGPNVIGYGDLKVEPIVNRV